VKSPVSPWAGWYWWFGRQSRGVLPPAAVARWTPPPALGRGHPTHCHLAIPDPLGGSGWASCKRSKLLSWSCNKHNSRSGWMGQNAPPKLTRSSLICYFKYEDFTVNKFPNTFWKNRSRKCWLVLNAFVQLRSFSVYLIGCITKNIILLTSSKYDV